MYFIHVTNVELFNTLIAAAEQAAARYQATFDARRSQGHYEFTTRHAGLWREMYLYGQVLAQAQDENIEGGETLNA